MPVVYVGESHATGKRRVLQLVFPRLIDEALPEHKRWAWDELRVGVSAIQGFGLFARDSAALKWGSLARPVAVPYLGKETEVESATTAKVLRHVLCGNFDVVRRSQLHTPRGHEWCQDGVYVTLLPKEEQARLGLEAVRPPANAKAPDVELCQVAVEPEYGARGTFSFDEGDKEVCYLRSDEVRELLHLPPHIFKLLEAHGRDEHADRNMATHLVQVTRKLTEHVLVNAHPLFRNGAFIMGNANEPPKGPPSLELLQLQLTPLDNGDPLLLRAGLEQSSQTVEMYRQFVEQHPEVAEKSTFFVTKRDSYDLADELTAVYGSSYKRTYSTWGHSGTPLAYRVPADTWQDGTWDTWAQWPLRCPGWFNVDRQPLNRPAFARVDPARAGGPTTIELRPDLPEVVKARRGALDGDSDEQRIARLDSLFLEWDLPTLAEAPIELPYRAHLATALPTLDRRPFVPWERRDWVDAMPPPLRGVHPSQWYGVGVSAKFRPETADETATPAPPDPHGPLGGGGGARADFELPAELRSADLTELRAQARAEEAPGGGKCFDEEPEEPNWASPWTFPIGSVVWCKMAGFAWWPAQVKPTEVSDRDTARMRHDGYVWVDFFAWGKRSMAFVEQARVQSRNQTNSPPKLLVLIAGSRAAQECTMTWAEGVAQGCLKPAPIPKNAKAKHKANASRLEAAKREARAVAESLPTPPLPAPPWWPNMAAPDAAEAVEEACGPIAEDIDLRKAARAQAEVTGEGEEGADRAADAAARTVSGSRTRARRCYDGAAAARVNLEVEYCRKAAAEYAEKSGVAPAATCFDVSARWRAWLQSHAEWNATGGPGRAADAAAVEEVATVEEAAAVQKVAVVEEAEASGAAKEHAVDEETDAAETEAIEETVEEVEVEEVEEMVEVEASIDDESAEEKPTAAEALRQAAAEGLTLARSAASNTGYTGVSFTCGRFQAKSPRRGGKPQTCLGNFGTAEEAALAVAREGAAALIKSMRCATWRSGYKGVVQAPSGRFQGSVYQGASERVTQHAHLGSFATAEAAALAVARYVRENGWGVGAESAPEEPPQSPKSPATVAAKRRERSSPPDGRRVAARRSSRGSADASQADASGANGVEADDAEIMSASATPPKAAARRTRSARDTEHAFLPMPPPKTDAGSSKAAEKREAESGGSVLSSISGIWQAAKRYQTTRYKI